MFLRGHQNRSKSRPAGSKQAIWDLRLPRPTASGNEPRQTKTSGLLGGYHDAEDQKAYVFNREDPWPFK